MLAWTPIPVGENSKSCKADHLQGGFAARRSDATSVGCLGIIIKFLINYPKNTGAVMTTITFDTHEFFNELKLCRFERTASRNDHQTAKGRSVFNA